VGVILRVLPGSFCKMGLFLRIAIPQLTFLLPLQPA